MKPWKLKLKLIGTDTYRSTTYDFLLTFHSNRGPVSFTVSEINGDFIRKSQNLPTPVYFAPLLQGFPLELGTGARGQKKLGWWGKWAEKEVWWYLQLSGYNSPTWRTHNGWQQRPHLHIASRGKNQTSSTYKHLQSSDTCTCFPSCSAQIQKRFNMFFLRTSKGLLGAMNIFRMKSCWPSAIRRQQSRSPYCTAHWVLAHCRNSVSTAECRRAHAISDPSN